MMSGAGASVAVMLDDLPEYSHNKVFVRIRPMDMDQSQYRRVVVPASPCHLLVLPLADHHQTSYCSGPDATYPRGQNLSRQLFGEARRRNSSDIDRASNVPLKTTKQFEFDRVFDTRTTQCELYEAAGKTLLTRILNGQDACLVTFGQANTGKTFSVFGTFRPDNSLSQPGIFPRIVDDLFQTFTQHAAKVEYHVKLSVAQIYLDDHVSDLLGNPKSNLKVVGKIDTNFEVEGLEWHSVGSYADAVALLSKANRKVVMAKSRGGETCSRAHTFTQLKVTTNRGGKNITRCFVIADLAGSDCEPVLPGFQGLYLDENKSINKSLESLNRVTYSLSENALKAAMGEYQKRVFGSRTRASFDEPKTHRMISKEKKGKVMNNERIVKVANNERKGKVANNERKGKVANNERKDKVANNERKGKVANNERKGKVANNERKGKVANNERKGKVANNERKGKVANNERKGKVAYHEPKEATNKLLKGKLKNILDPQRRGWEMDISSDKQTSTNKVGATSVKARNGGPTIKEDTQKVFSELVDKTQHISWRDSSLTKLLKRYLCKTDWVLLVTLSQSSHQVRESLNSLIFASNACFQPLKLQQAMEEKSTCVEFKEKQCGCGKTIGEQEYQELIVKVEQMKLENLSLKEMNHVLAQELVEQVDENVQLRHRVVAECNQHEAKQQIDSLAGYKVWEKLPKFFPGVHDYSTDPVIAMYQKTVMELQEQLLRARCTVHQQQTLQKQPHRNSKTDYENTQLTSAIKNTKLSIAKAISYLESKNI